MNKDIVRQWANVIATVVMIVVNILANALPINNLTTGDIADQFDVYFVPAGYVFSIWGLIYLLVGLFTVYQALPAQRENELLRRVGYWYVVSALANTSWIFLWHYEQFPLSLVPMLVLLLSLIMVYLNLGIGRLQLPTTVKWALHIPFSVYLGWVTVATIANVTSVLDYMDWGGWGISPVVWTVIMLIVATGVAALVSLTRGDIAYIAVIVWAFVGIAVKHWDTPAVAITAILMAVVAAATLIKGVPQVQERRVPLEPA